MTGICLIPGRSTSDLLPVVWFKAEAQSREEMDVSASALHPAPSSPSSPQAGREDLISRCTSRNMACRVVEFLIRSLLLQFLEGISITSDQDELQDVTGSVQCHTGQGL